MYYIAYGSNINLDQMAYRCPHSKVVGHGILKGWKLVFNVHADIIYSGKKKDETPVLIWEIAEEDWASLDRYEGFPKYYIKKKINTHFDDGHCEKCIVYVMADNRKGWEMPFDSYFRTIAIGYEQNGFDYNYLEDALNETWWKIND